MDEALSLKYEIETGQNSCSRNKTLAEIFSIHVKFGLKVVFQVGSFHEVSHELCCYFQKHVV